MITMERIARRRRAAAMLITTGALAMNAGVTAKRADAAAVPVDTPLSAASQGLYTPCMRDRVELEEQPRLYDLDPNGPDPEPGRALEQVAATVTLTAPEVEHLRVILREAMAGDLDLLEDTLYQTCLVDEDAVARVALAVRLEAALA